MRLPTSLQTAIEEICLSLGLSQLIEAREALTERYRKPASQTPFMKSDAERQAYVVSRMPATYAALQATMGSIGKEAALPIKSILDLGAGPGTAMWAACDHFPEINSITLIERDRALSAIGKKLAQTSSQIAIQNALWIEDDMEQLSSLPPHDLVILSYSIGELQPEKIKTLLSLCWKAASQLLLIVEPGTPAGFERIRLLRTLLIDEGAHLLAPCPHALRCPMQGGDWCHFSARVERSSLHRRLKGGSLGHEDEKFSYIAATKIPSSPSPPRVLRQPERHSGHIIFSLCKPEGIQKMTVSKKMGDLFRQARKAEWGDAFPPSGPVS